MKRKFDRLIASGVYWIESSDERDTKGIRRRLGEKSWDNVRQLIIPQS